MGSGPSEYDRFHYDGHIASHRCGHVCIKEFVLIRKINIQKDTDEMTGLMNKSALTHEINEYLAKPTSEHGIIFLHDIDHFKSINDTYGHDAGDIVIRRLGLFLAE